jgi:replicative DNA helicase
MGALSFVVADELAAAHLKDLERRLETWTVVPTVLPSLNQKLGGGFSAGVHYFAGATGISKTAIALQFARKTAQEGRPVVYVSLELRPEDLLDRMVSQELGLAWAKVRAGEYYEEAAEVFWELKGQPLYFADRRQDFKRVLQDAGNLDKTPLVIVDYLQLAADRFMKGDPRDRVSQMSQMLSEFANQAEAPVLVISSIARSRYTDMEPTPESCLAAAKESGQVEYEATSLNVMMLCGDYETIPRPGFWVLAKNRFGPPGVIRVSVDGLKGLIEEVSDDVNPEALERQLLSLVASRKKSNDESVYTIDKIAALVAREKEVVRIHVDSLRKRGLVKVGVLGYVATAEGHAFLQR